MNYYVHYETATRHQLKKLFFKNEIFL